MTTQAQNHVDLFKMGYGETFKNNFKDSLSRTHIYAFDADLTIPIKLNQKHALISGVDYNSNKLQLYPEAEFSKLQSTTLKLGLASQWNEKWSSAIVLLPKFAAEKDLTDNFFMGILATAKMKKTDNFSWRFGLYASTEAYGIFTTPVIGWTYLSSNNNFEMDMSLPVKGDLNYKFGIMRLGADYLAIARSFELKAEENRNLYTDLSSLKFSAYVQMDALKESLIVRAKIGYSSDKYEVYDSSEKKILKLSAFNFGDHRKQLNPDIQPGPFFKIEAVYRFHTAAK